MIVTVALFELQIEYAESLKDKRTVVRSLRDRIRGRFAVAVNEVAYQDVHERARMAIAFISDRHDSADSLLSKLQDFVESNANAVVAGWTVEKLEFDAEAGR